MEAASIDTGGPEEIGQKNHPREITHIKEEEPGGSLGDEGGIGIPPTSKYARLR